MSENLTVTKSFLQKAIGLTEAVKGIMDKRAAAVEDTRATAQEAVAALAKKGYVEDGKASSVIEGFINEPKLVLESLSKLAVKLPHIDAVVAPGAPAEKEAGANSSKKESDRVWDTGFGLQS